MGKKMQKCTVNGVTYRSFSAACYAHKKEPCTISLRMRTKGLSAEEAINVWSFRNTLSKDHLGNVYESFEAMCKAWGLKVGMVYARLNRGWSVKKALTTVSQRDPNKWQKL